jgi:hypothetical protein
MRGSENGKNSGSTEIETTAGGTQAMTRWEENNARVVRTGANSAFADAIVESNSSVVELGPEYVDLPKREENNSTAVTSADGKDSRFEMGPEYTDGKDSMVEHADSSTDDANSSVIELGPEYAHLPKRERNRCTHTILCKCNTRTH